MLFNNKLATTDRKRVFMDSLVQMWDESYKLDSPNELHFEINGEKYCEDSPEDIWTGALEDAIFSQSEGVIHVLTENEEEVFAIPYRVSTSGKYIRSYIIR